MRRPSILNRLCQTEVQHFHGPVVVAHFDVRRLQITVNHAVLVRGGQRIRDLARNREGFRKGERSPSDAIGQGRPFHELEDEGVHVIAVLDAVNRGDVWMIERRENVRLAAEPRETIGVTRERFG